VRRLRLALALVAALAGLGAAAPRSCEGQLGPRWGALLCQSEGLATAWSVMDLRETPDRRDERARFDANIGLCLHDRDARNQTDRSAAFACVRSRVWARTHALALRGEGGGFTGRWLLQSERAAGEARVLVMAPTVVLLELRTVARGNGHVCALRLDDAWAGENEVAWKGVLNPAHPESECDISVRRTGAGTIRIDSTNRCAWICGAGGEYRGIYAIQP